MAEDSGGQQIGFWMRFVIVLQDLLGRQRNQQQLEQFQRSDRQLADGFNRGAEDPDNRRMQQQTTDYNYDVVQQARVRVQEQGSAGASPPQETTPTRPTPVQERNAALLAQIELAQQRWQQMQQSQQSRGQGRGL